MYAHQSTIAPKKTRSIPMKLNYAWEGKDLPQEALANVLRLLSASEYEVNIWTTRPMTVARTLTAMADSDNNSGYRYLAREYGEFISINDVNSLYRRLSHSHKNGPKLEAMFYREINGPYRNYAAASDLTRAALAYEEGGLYLDTDVYISPLDEINTVTDFLIPPPQMGRGTSNAAIASQPHSPLAGQFIDEIIAATSELDEFSSQASWSSKRSNMSYSEQTGKNTPLAGESPFGRLRGTTNTSGPGALRRLGIHNKPEHWIPPAQKFYYQPDSVQTSDSGKLKPVARSLQQILYGSDWRSGFDASGRWSKPQPSRRSSVV